MAVYGSNEFLGDIAVSRETINLLEEYVALVLRWQKSINLVGPSTVKDIWRRHILDCAQLYRYLKPPGSLMDLGSGAGLPGLVIAILGHSKVKLIESNKTKCTFLREASRSLGISVEIIDSRIEEVKLTKTADYITSRALAPLDQLLCYSARLLGHQGKCYFLKGHNIESELTAAKKNWNMMVTKHRSKSCTDGVILEITGRRQKHDKTQPSRG